MTTTAPGRTAPEIATFVDQVRARLSDLTDEERDELTGGLEADLADQIADGTAWSELGDPDTYAAELRLAAGLPEPTRSLLRPRALRPEGVEQVLDGGRAWFFHVVEAKDWSRATWDFVRELRPVWWVARAWLALTLLDVVAGYAEPISVVPSLGHPLVGPALLAVAVVLSVLVGLGRCWPGSGVQRSAASRVVLLAVNVALVLGVLTFDMTAPGYLTGTPTYDGASDGYSVGYEDGRRAAQPPGLHVGRQQVANVFAYDAQGQPIPAVQLFDQDGVPLDVARNSSTGRGASRQVPCPTYDENAPLLNVFPLHHVRLRAGRCLPETIGRTTPPPPFTQVPPLATAAGSSPAPGSPE